MPQDVNNSGTVTPFDVLLAIRELRRTGARLLSTTSDMDEPYWDANGDGKLTPNDVLTVIQAVNSAPRDPEGEPSSQIEAGIDAFAWAQPSLFVSRPPGTDRSDSFAASSGEASPRRLGEGNIWSASVPWSKLSQSEESESLAPAGLHVMDQLESVLDEIHPSSFMN